jgi:hypothetical protein
MVPNRVGRRQGLAQPSQIVGQHQAHRHFDIGEGAAVAQVGRLMVGQFAALAAASKVGDEGGEVVGGHGW